MNLLRWLARLCLPHPPERPARRSRPLAVERLEDRCQPSAGVWTAGVPEVPVAGYPDLAVIHQVSAPEGTAEQAPVTSLGEGPGGVAGVVTEGSLLTPQDQLLSPFPSVVRGKNETRNVLILDTLFTSDPHDWTPGAVLSDPWPAGSRPWPVDVSQFFSPVVLGALQGADADAVLAPREAEVTVLFCDLRGFSREAERQPLRPLLDHVSQALGLVTRNVLAEDGVIGDFHGDAVMGFWGWPRPQADMVSRACRTALEVRARFEEAGRRAGRDPAHPLVGIGVATGTALAGKIGTADQVKVTAFGPVVNLAARLEGLTKLLRVPILLDETTARLVRETVPADVARVRRLAPVRPYGLETALTVSELLPPAAASALGDDHLARYEAALDAFVAGDWPTASAWLDGLPAEDRGKDFLAAYIDRHGGTPPPQWDGIIRMESKS